MLRHFFSKLRSSVAAATKRSRFESELDAELDDHLAKYTDELIARGISRDDAERRAHLEFGGVALIKDEVRESSGLAFADALARNLRYAARVLRKSPVFTATAVATLALCIGANTAIFSVVDAMLFRPLPYPEPERLASIELSQRAPSGESRATTAIDGTTWEYLRDQPESIDAAITGSGGAALLIGPDQSARYVQQARVSSGYFRVLGLPLVMGREFTLEEDRPGGPPVAVVGETLWRTALGGSPQVLGGSILLKGEPYTVIGIAPALPDQPSRPDVYIPLQPSKTGEGGGVNYGTMVRIRDGYTWEQANAELASAPPAAYLAREPPPEVTSRLRLISPLTAAAGSYRTRVLLLWAAVGIVLLIGCVNVASLMLARSGTRRQEIATRLALGSGRGGIIGQLLAESALLGIAGGVAGLVLGYFALQGLRPIAVSALGLSQPASIDPRVLAMTAATALLTSLLFGLYPALAISRTDLRSGLAVSSRTASARRSAWVRRGLVVAQVALGMILLVGAGLMLRTFAYFANLDPGYEGRDVIAASLPLQDARYDTAEEVNLLFDSSLDRIRRSPGILAAGVGLGLPYERVLNSGVRVTDGPNARENREISNVTYVTPGYFEALRMRLIKGRLFDERDRAGSEPVVIVNQAYQRRYIRNDDPLLRHLDAGGEVASIVGVVGDVQQQGGFSGFEPIDRMPQIYVPAAQQDDGMFRISHTWFSPKWIVHSAAPRAETEQILRAALADVDPQLPFFSFTGMEELRSASYRSQQAQSLLLGGLAALALLLAAIGIYSVIANAVVERTREFGIRLALGAPRWQAVTAAARPGIVLTLVGIAAGYLLARWATAAIASMLYGVRPGDPATLWAVMAILLVVAALASLLPSLRIARIDPARTLREE